MPPAPAHPSAALAALILPGVRRAMAEARRRPFVLGISGAQGSGKSTLAARLAAALGAAGSRCVLLSLDDLYLDGERRSALARAVHPLLRTRGVPGTHDVALGLHVIEALERGEAVMLPRFDKARDEPGAPEPFAGPADVLIFEGWCVGARAEDEAALAAPVNALERDRDPDGTWRRYVNAQLAGPYRALFDRIDRLVLLAAPGFDVVAGWRIEQERRSAGPMTDDQVRAFVEHYRRITQHLLRHGESWADVTIRLDAERRTLSTSGAGP